jgi:hypothetical protein
LHDLARRVRIGRIKVDAGFSPDERFVGGQVQQRDLCARWDCRKVDDDVDALGRGKQYLGHRDGSSPPSAP